MYQVAVEREFDARHFLFGGDWGDENSPHVHHYKVELRLKGASLDEHGYLADIADIERFLDQQVDRYRNRLLNSMPEFSALNPSIEHFARILCKSFAGHLSKNRLSAVSVKVWESSIAWASYEEEP